LKIAILVNSSWNILNFRSSLIKALISAEHEVFVLAPFENTVEKIENLGCTYIRIENIRRKGKNPFRDILLIKELTKIFRKFEIDLLMSYTIKPNIYGSISAHFSKVKSICTVTGLGYSFLTKSAVNKVVKRLYKYAFSKADIVVFQNPDDLNLFVNLELVSQNKVKLIYGSGIDTEKFQPYNNIKNSKRVDFLFVGRLLFDKGISELLKAVKSLTETSSDIQLHVVGDIDKNNPASIDEEWLQKFGKSEYITYYGYQDNVKPFIEMADVVILPSYREGLPRVMLEALSMEKPVITTDVPGCREIIDNEMNGFLVPAKSSSHIAEAMLRMVSLSNTERTQMGKHGRIIALSKFSTEIVNSEYLDLVKNMTE
jgi:glycosyltransferase involved in cell wall biosynthesis